MERLIVIPLDGKPGHFSAYLQRTSAPVVTGSKQPLADGARKLLAHGFDPGTLLTIRHQGSAHDSLPPLPIGKWAKLTYEEREQGGLRCVRWRPPPFRMAPELTLGGQKLTSGPSSLPKPTPEQERLYEATFQTAA